MTNIINFAAFKNARRVAAEVDARTAAAAERVANEKAKLTDRLGGTYGAEVVASVLVDLKEKDRAASSGYMPAYCDPENEVRGSKYEATRHLDIAEIAKRMRQDIKALGLAKGFKASVRVQRYSGGQSIDISMTVPEGFRFYSEKMASWTKQFPHSGRVPISIEEQHSPEYNDLKAKLSAIHSAYNRDNSDSMTDYFDTRFYGHAEIAGSWEALKREAAESKGDYWAPDCA